jgi:hypothetical protein
MDRARGVAPEIHNYDRMKLLLNLDEEIENTLE